ncbi:hypothetical protein EVAR_22957_1 [Eumeta japonica]|uniref:Uncharacterized protein n=1 Tax=Eumeta variegata TaxID=151549 RepID=A0A4C1URN7_EUMVA|nr:hypothetical protein EVAR_22957_1 [Eumeta japonica]
MRLLLSEASSVRLHRPLFLEAFITRLDRLHDGSQNFVRRGGATVPSPQRVTERAGNSARDTEVSFKKRSVAGRARTPVIYPPRPFRIRAREAYFILSAAGGAGGAGAARRGGPFMVLIYIFDLFLTLLRLLVETLNA